MNSSKNIPEEACGGNTGVGNDKSPWRRFNFAVVACILALAALLGVLNNLRVAKERKVKWFDTSAELDNLGAAEEVNP